MEFEFKINRGKQENLLNFMIFDSNILMRLYNGSLSEDDILEIVSAGIAFNLCFYNTPFTYFEFFKGVSNENECVKRLKFLESRFGGLLQYKRIGFDDKLVPSYWLANGKFDYGEFSKFFEDFKLKIYEIVKENIVYVIDGIVGISIAVKVLNGKLNNDCIMKYFNSTSNKEKENARLKLINEVIDKHFRGIFFDKQKSKKMIDDLVCLEMSIFNMQNDDIPLTYPANREDIVELLKSKDKECVYFKGLSDINCKSVAKLCESYFKYLCRNNERSLQIVGFNKLITDYIASNRKISTNDIIDLLNLISVEAVIPNATIYYATKDNYWNNEFIDKFAFNESKIINCKILDLVQIKIN